MITMKHTLLLLMLVTASWATAQESPVFPVLLTQQLYHAPRSIAVSHRHDVTIVFDTANYVNVRTVGRVDELDSLRFPQGQLRMSGDRLILDSAFPYRSGIEVHTAAPKVEVEARYFSRVTIRSHDRLPARRESFEAMAYTNSLVFVDVPVLCTDFVSLGAFREGAVVYYDSVDAPKRGLTLHDGGVIVHLTPDGGSETHRVERYLPFGYLDLFSSDGYNHRDLPIFMNFSFGLSGASQHPFGGVTGRMGDFRMSMGYQINYSFHYSFALGSHWSLGAGFGTGASTYRADNCLLGLTPNATAGEPAHLGPVAEPATPGAGQRTWTSDFSAVYMYLPLRVEWRQRNDWRGLRAAVELQPGINYYRSNTILYCNGSLTDGNRTDLLADKTLGDRLATWRCDLRLELAWSHLGLFLQTSFTPLFRTDGADALDCKYFPMSFGFSFTI